MPRPRTKHVTPTMTQKAVFILKSPLLLIYHFI